MTALSRPAAQSKKIASVREESEYTDRHDRLCQPMHKIKLIKTIIACEINLSDNSIPVAVRIGGDAFISCADGPAGSEVVLTIRNINNERIEFNNNNSICLRSVGK